MLLSFIRGFRIGVWRSVFNLVGVAAAFLGAYALAGPAVDFLNTRWDLLQKTATWWRRAFDAVPPLLVPYDPGTFDEAFSSIGGASWGRLLQGAVKQNLLAVGALASPEPTWSEMLSLALARLLLSSVAFFVLFSILRIVAEGIVKSLGFTTPDSFLVRLWGGIVETALSLVWLSLLAGVLYPFLTAGFLGRAREAAAGSYLVAVLLSVYQTIWPAIIARVKL